jgi:HK97 family phage portal protein
MSLNPFRRAPEVVPAEASETRDLSEAQILDLAFGFASSLSNGFNVTQETAFASNAVLACLIVRAETFSSLPVHVYQRAGASRDVVDDPLAVLVGDFANPLMTAPELWRWKQITEDVRGQAHVYVERTGGRPSALWPMTARDIRMQYDKVGREAFYEYPGDAVLDAGTYPGRDVLHFRGPLNKDAYAGTSLVDKAKTAIGLTVSSERFYDRLLNNGSHFPGHLETDTTLKPEDITALSDQFKAFSGVDHAGEWRIFDRGLKLVQNKMNIEEADLTAQQAWYLQEVCRVFRVPPPLVQDWSHSTYTNSEQADLWFTKHTIRPIARNSEAVVKRLFVRAAATDRYVKWELDGLLRGEYKTRAEGYSTLINCGVLAPNEARALEDMNPYEEGDSFLRPLNMTAVGDDVDDVKKRVDAAGILVRSGFDPSAAAEVVGLPEIPYTDVQPVTVRPVNASGVQIAPADAADADAVDPLEPIRSEKLDLIRTRAGQDRDRGRDQEATRAFATKVLAPLAESYRLAGLTIDTEALIEEALA